MAFHVTENLYYYIMQLVFKIKKYLLPIPGGGVHGTLVPEVYFYYFHCEGERKNKPLVESGN